VTTYVDSSALVAVYVPERFSESARRALGATAQVPWNDLHHLEVANALRMLLGRRLISREEHRSVQTQLQEDLDSQRLVPVALDWPAVFLAARELSGAHTARLLTRSLDLLHVAAAHAASCRTFVSADDRQLAVAKATGMAVVDIKRRVRKSRS
jgi:uncharacterized protein